MIEAIYVLTIDDLVESAKQVYADDRSILRFRVQWLIVGIGLIAIVVMQKPSPIYWLMLIGIFFIWIAISYPGQHLKRHFQKSVTNEEITTQIDESGVRTASPTSRAEWRWEAFRSTYETPSTISLITIENAFLVFPKRAFSKESWEGLRSMIAKKVPSKL